jgi:molybdopterin converting factor small subunit
MRVAVIPQLDKLKVIVNSSADLTSEICNVYLPDKYAPWPDARQKGFVEIDLEGDTLRVLLEEIGIRYKQVNLDFEPICRETNDLKQEYDMLVNGKNWALLTKGLDTKLQDGDEISIWADIVGYC